MKTRPIKFKAVTKEGNIIDVASIQFMEDGSCIVNNEFPIYGKNLLQFTGLRDKNGKEIWEGDIRQDGNYVAWNQLHCCFGWFNSSGYRKDLLADEYDNHGNIRTEWMIEDEVIGNIFQNDDLLN